MRKLALAAAAAAVVGLFAGGAMAVKPVDDETKGNGLPKISMSDAWQLNIHAYDSCPSGDFDGSNRRTIVVQSTNVNAANTKHNNGEPDTSDLNDIWLAVHPSDTFEITDGNACDAGVDDGGADRGAELLLPSLVASNYDLYVKFRGKPGTQLDPVLCAVDDTEGTFCHTGSAIQIRETGGDKIQFKNFTSQLLNVQDVFDICQGNVCDLFDPALEDWFWDWSASNGAKATIVFVPCAASKGGHADDPTLSECVF